MESKILQKFKLHPQDIEVKISNFSTRIVSPKLEKLIEEKWKEVYENAVSQGKKIWNSRVYRVNEYSFKDNKLFVELGPSEFKYSRVARLIPEFEEHTEEFYPLNMFSLANLKTLDDKYVFGYSEKTMQYNSVLGVGGVYSMDELIIHDSQDIFQNMFKELSEELNIKKEQIAEFYLAGLVETEGGNFGFIFNINLNITSDEVLKQYQDKNDGEFERVIFVEKENYKDYMKNFSPGHKSLLYDFTV